MEINKFKIPNRVITDIKRNAPTYTVSENYGRPGGFFGDYDENATGYKSICIYIQNGLAAYIGLFKEIAKVVFQIQSGNQRKYPLLVFGFGKTDHLQHEGKYFDFGYTNDSYNVEKVAVTMARISGDNPISPGVIPELFPKTDIRSLYHGKTKIDRDDLLIIIGEKDKVFFSNKLVDKITSSLKKQILFVDIENGNTINCIFKLNEIKFNEALILKNENSMYYNRKISNSFSKLLEKGGELRPLFNFVKKHNELDFLIGKNKSKEFISIYRGLTRILSILQTDNPQRIYLDADIKYKRISNNLYGERSINDNFQNDIENLITEIEQDSIFDRYYKNKKEGYFQNELSKKYGICSNANDNFVIIDKEAVIGYSNQKEKDIIFGGIQQKYKQLQKDISILNPERYGKDIGKKAIGNELDFLALDKDGNILLIEYKHGSNTSGIYLSPLQIGLYYDIFTKFSKNDLECSVFEMLEQKQKIGLINPSWPKPNFIKDIIPVLMISEFNYKSSAKMKFEEILDYVRSKLGSGFLNNLQTYNFTLKNGLSKW